MECYRQTQPELLKSPRKLRALRTFIPTLNKALSENLIMRFPSIASLLFVTLAGGAMCQDTSLTTTSSTVSFPVPSIVTNEGVATSTAETSTFWTTVTVNATAVVAETVTATSTDTSVVVMPTEKSTKVVTSVVDTVTTTLTTQVVQTSSILVPPTATAATTTTTSVTTSTDVNRSGAGKNAIYGLGSLCAFGVAAVMMF